MTWYVSPLIPISLICSIVSNLGFHLSQPVQSSSIWEPWHGHGYGCRKGGRGECLSSFPSIDIPFFNPTAIFHPPHPRFGDPTTDPSSVSSYRRTTKQHIPQSLYLSLLIISYFSIVYLFFFFSPFPLLTISFNLFLGCCSLSYMVKND